MVAEWWRAYRGGGAFTPLSSCRVGVHTPSSVQGGRHPLWPLWGYFISEAVVWAPVCGGVLVACHSAFHRSPGPAAEWGS